MNRKTVPKVDIRLGNEKEAKIVFLGDFHYGHQDCAVEELKKTINWVKEHKNAYVILMGDLLEISVENHLPGSMYTQEITPNQQRKDLIEMLYPIRGKILGAIDGNHERSRGWKLNSISPIEVITESLGVPYWGIGGYVVLNLWNGKKHQTYNLLVFHGIGSSITPTYLIDKALNIYKDVDLVAFGHLHNLANGYRLTRTLDPKTLKENDKKTTWVRTGSYLHSPDYAIEALYPPSIIGSPVVLFKLDEKRIFVNQLEY